MNKEIICTVCPRGCHITVTGDGKNIENIEGYICKRGLNYAQNEYISPVRILTTTVKIDGMQYELLPVRSENPLPKDKIFDCMEVIKNTSVSLPVGRYDVVIENICDTGVNILATKDLK